MKAAGRARLGAFRLLFPSLFLRPREKTVSLIGAGQFGFAVISYFLLRERGNVFLNCFDVDDANAQRAAGFYGYKKCKTVEELLANSQCKYVYIASNHSSHTDYAVTALKAGKTVYVEKPISVNYTQFRKLLRALKKTSGQLFVGYNRPFSPAVMEIDHAIKNSGKPLSLSCFIIGHKIPDDHWYRNPEEGTRICGNVGHWIDLACHLLTTRGVVPSNFKVTISYSDLSEPDDNLTVSLSTDYGDLITITLSSREEPFEGINETINLQCGDVIAKIDDFRKITIWNKDSVETLAFSPKNVGHRRAVNQPFSTKYPRDFDEVKLSTVIMLEITAMVLNRETSRTIAPLDILVELEQENDEANYTRH